MRRLLAFTTVLFALAAVPAQAKLPPVKHVWVIALENQDATKTFAADSPAPYLAKTLRSRGQFLPNYYGVTHFSLGNYIALVSGQGSNPETQADCQFYRDITPGVILTSGQAMGSGCVYPRQAKTIADQLQSKGLSWRGYMEDMGNDVSRDKSSTCGHPAFNTVDKTQKAAVGDQYATRHNPFAYFHSLLDSGLCAKYDLPLTRLQGDLKASRVPSYSFITPNLCNDGHDAPCVDGKPGGLKGIDGFLRTWIPRIQATKAYRDGGLIVVTFDEAENESTACCNEPKFPNTANNGGAEQGPGGGRVGTVLLSKYVKAGSVNKTPYNHFSLLRSTEDLFGLSHLGYAAQTGLKPFGSDVYNAPRCGEPAARPVSRGGRFSRGTLIASARVRGRTLTVKMRRRARVGGLIGGRNVLRIRQTYPCRTYTYKLPVAHGKIVLRARRNHALEQRALRF